MASPLAPQLSDHPLRREILEEARQQAEQIRAQARHEAEAIRSAADTAAKTAWSEDLATAQAEARRRHEAILATVAVRISRLRSHREESTLLALRAETLARLQALDERESLDALLALVTDAMVQMTGDRFTVRLRPEDLARLGPDAAQQLRRRTGRQQLEVRLVSDLSPEDAGLIVEQTDGTRRSDQRFARRLERLWPELRHQIAAHLGWLPATPAAALEPSTP